MLILDRAFEAAFRRLFVYNILFEDSEVDGRYFALDQQSKVVGISAAGCGLASMVRFHPTSIDAVDINAHHLSLAALKMEATRRIKNYELLYATFGYGRLAKPERIIKPLAQHLPDWMQRYWSQNYGRFSRSFYESGVTAWMLGKLRRYVGLDSSWMKKFTALSSPE